jgi:hypothetical protein
MEKIVKIDKKDLDFNLNKIKEIKRIDIHEDYLQLIILLED